MFLSVLQLVLLKFKITWYFGPPAAVVSFIFYSILSVNYPPFSGHSNLYSATQKGASHA